ncbi:hypothetical protein SPPR111872_18685 [Sphingobacterium prati]
MYLHNIYSILMAKITNHLELEEEPRADCQCSYFRLEARAEKLAVAMGRKLCTLQTVLPLHMTKQQIRLISSQRKTNTIIYH